MNKIIYILIMLIMGYSTFVLGKSKIEQNKEKAMAFYDLAFNQAKPKEAVEQYVGTQYIQHNPHVKDGKEGFIEYFNRMAKAYPNKKVIFKRIIAENNLVVLHCLQKWPGDDDWASIDIFRFDDRGKIVEHWDVLQKISQNSANGNGLF